MPSRGWSIRSTAGLWLAGVMLLVAAGLAPDAGAATVQVAPLDAPAAARVPIVGGTAGEVAAARRALAAVVDDLAVRRVVFGWQGKRRSVAVVLAGGRAVIGPGIAGAERYWLGSLLGQAIAAARAGASHPIRWVELRPSGGAVWSPGVRPRRDAAGLAALGQAIVDRAAAAGWDDATVRGWQLGPGAVSVRVRISELQFLAGRTDWASTLVGDRRAPGAGYDALHAVEAPDGTVLSLGGNIGGSAGFAGYGAERPARLAPPPAGLAGATRLKIDLKLLEDPLPA